MQLLSIALRCNVARCAATWRAAVQQTIKLADRRADVEIGLEYDDEALRTLPWVLFYRCLVPFVDRRSSIRSINRAGLKELIFK
jgi:hypothetical protein